ncbi:MAG: hypothetical protein P8J50_04490 [Acidimicrobiales bacterium]|jgi:hypothetical protein|nr:hypothetical protein [Acidimicrobiales bacterium]
MSMLARPPALLLTVAACGTGDVSVEPLPALEPSSDAVTSSTTTTSTTTTSTTSTTAAPTTTTSPPAVYHSQDYTPMTTVGPLTLTHPAARVEHIGFHQSGHDGSQGQFTMESSAPSTVLEDRGRNTERTGAADVVVDPTAEIRSPVTGTVIRAGGYIPTATTRTTSS